MKYYIPKHRAESAWIGHLPFAYWLMEFIKPKVFVELGSHWGNSYFSFCESVDDNKLETKCYAVDTWSGDEHTENYGEEVFAHITEHNKNYRSFSELKRSTFDEALDSFEDDSIDLLHIDGLHTYEAVKHDFESWLPKLTSNAIVLFHDTHVREKDFGVYKLWEELIERYDNNFAFSHSHGLGVICINNSPSSEIDKLFNTYLSSDEYLKEILINAKYVEEILSAERLQSTKEIQDREAVALHAKLAAAIADSQETHSRLNLALKDSKETHSKLSDSFKENQKVSSRLSDVSKDNKETHSRLSDALINNKETHSRLSDVSKDNKETHSRLSDALINNKETHSRLSDALINNKETHSRLSDALINNKETHSRLSDALINNKETHAKLHQAQLECIKKDKQIESAVNWQKNPLKRIFKKWKPLN